MQALPASQPPNAARSVPRLWIATLGVTACLGAWPDADAIAAGGIRDIYGRTDGAGQDATIDPSQFCRAAIAATERETGIPDAFLSAIGRVESGREQAGSRNPWPWTVNAAGEGHFYPTKQAAIDAVRHFLATGVRSLDVGCLQVNLQYHPDAFADLQRAFDPADNAAYAGRLLLELFRTTGSWPRAAAAYHSMTPALGTAYLQRVLAEWALPDRDVALGAPHGRSAGLSVAKAPPQPASPSAPLLAQGGDAAAPPPAFGFSRRFMLAAGPAQGRAAPGRTLAAYRALPVRVAMGTIKVMP